ncbi:hypothetical protein [Baaleninema simplex]|nr:hypothetical protein [Baaleninema simplex]
MKTVTSHQSPVASLLQGTGNGEQSPVTREDSRQSPVTRENRERGTGNS